MLSFHQIFLLQRVILLFVVLGFSNSLVVAQLQSCKWLFGQGAYVDFIDGVPVIRDGSKINTSEGCSTVSSSDGSLLFYTDGVSVWDRKHELMPNGQHLNGHFSSTQSVVIVPSVSNNSQYFLFTQDKEAGNGGFSYSVVDMTLNDGFGDLVVLNKLVTNNCAEKVATVRHLNGKDIWIIVHDAGSNIFMSYLLTDKGLLTEPVYSSVGISFKNRLYNTIGYLKVSPDCRKIAAAVMGERLVQLFDFDAGNGQISNPVDYKFGSDSNPYGIEFSPNSQYLYVGSTLYGSIYQIDIGLPGNIDECISLVGKTRTKKGVGALQLAIDGKIYVSEYESKFLSVIQFPDSAGRKCQFKNESLMLNGAKAMLGLPTFFHEYVRPFHYYKRGAVIDNTIVLNKNYVFNKLYFDFDKIDVKKSSTDEIHILYSYLQKFRNARVEITGHTDSIGSLAYNHHLSLHRALKVKEMLLNHGISPERVLTFGKGSTQPVCSNTTDEGRSLNRRVEFVVKM